MTKPSTDAPKRTPVELVQLRIKHYEDEAKNLEVLFEQFRERLGQESQVDTLMNANRVQTFVKELTSIESLRAANRAVLSELEVLRIVLEG